MNKLMPVLMMLGLAVPAMAEQGYDSGYRQDGSYAPTARIRYVEPSVTLQRASEDASQDSSEEAQANAPFLPGDRMWTNDSGRAELQFPSSAFLRMDTQSSLEYVSDGARLAFRLDSGGLYVHARRGGDLTIETPGGLVTLQSGVYRIDADSGETRLTVLEGGAWLDSGGRQVDVRAGERTYASKGEPPEDPQRFDRADGDDFASWDRNRESRVAYYAGESRRYLPAEVASYADDFDTHGSWANDDEVGRVWRPSVDADWSPYSNGRWTWTVYGWTWCPYETWGWAPFHYGRWGFGVRLGWYWIPGSVWGPAWVSWAHGGDYVGWCPLGFHDRPVIGIGVGDDRFARRAWFYTRRADILAPQIARRRISASPDVIGAVRVSSPGTQPSRDLRTVHAMPMPTARLRSQGAPLGSRSEIRPTTPGEGARVRIPERSANGHPDRQGGIGRATDRNGVSTDTPSRRWYNDRPIPRGQTGRTMDQGGTGHATDRNGVSTDTPSRRWYNDRPVPRGQTGRTMDQGGSGRATDRNSPSTYTPSRQWYSERPVPRGQAGRTTDSGGFNNGSSARRRVDTAPSTAGRGDFQGRSNVWDRPSARESAPRAVERSLPQASRPVPSPSRDYGAGFGNRSSQPSYERPMPRSEASRSPRVDSAPRLSQPHYAPPHAEPRSTPPPAEAGGRDRHPHGR
jgi:hypothetical protein